MNEYFSNCLKALEEKGTDLVLNLGKKNLDGKRAVYTQPELKKAWIKAIKGL